jgi:hypothetical protein
LQYPLIKHETQRARERKQREADCMAAKRLPHRSQDERREEAT